jgi:glucose-1-phosphatase
VNPPVVVMDIGDVLIRTIPMAQYRKLAQCTRIPWEHIAERIEGSGSVTAFERGEITSADFVDALRRLLSYPGLSAIDVESAWNAIVAGPDPILAPLAASFATQGRLRLASNTNPFHWRVVRTTLASVGIYAPACLSFEVGYTKPDPRFLAALCATVRLADGPVVYVDDRLDNVNAACRRGLTGWVHRDSAVTAAYLRALPT